MSLRDELQDLAHELGGSVGWDTIIPTLTDDQLHDLETVCTRAISEGIPDADTLPYLLSHLQLATRDAIMAFFR